MKQPVNLTAPELGEVTILQDLVDEDLLEQLGRQAVKDLLVVKDRSEHLFGDLDIVHEDDLVERGVGGVAPVEKRDDVPELFQDLGVLLRPGMLIAGLPHLKQQALEGKVAFLEGLQLSPKQHD